MSKEVAEVEIQARANGLNAQLREIRARFGKFADGVGETMKRGWGRAFKKAKEKEPKEGFLRGAGKSAVGNLVASGTERAIGFVAELGRGTLDFEEKLARLQIQANETPETMRAFASSITAASNATGIGKTAILDGANAFVTLTGDMKTAKDQAATFAKVAQATGSNVDDIAKAAAAASQNLGVSAGDFESLFDVMTAQGKAGAIELKDMAAELSTIAPQWAQFAGGKGLQGARQLGAAMQIVKKGFGGDAGETTVGLSNFLTAVAKKSDRFGISKIFDVKDGKKQLKDVFTIIDNISKSKIAKDDTALRKAFGSIEAYRAYIQLRDNRVELDRLANSASAAGTIQRDFNTFMESSAGRMAKAWENMKNAIAGALTPERINAFANAIESLAEKVGPVADFLGLASDVLGGISGVGKSIRGALSNENPFQSVPMSDLIMGPGGQVVAKDSAEGKKMLGAQRGFDQTVGDILGGEKGDRTTPESIRRAVMARFSENAGAATAGNRYLANVYSSGSEVSDAVDKVVREEFQKFGAGLAASVGLGNNDRTRELVSLLTAIAANTGADKEIKVGADPVAKAAKNAPSNRTKVAR